MIIVFNCPGCGAILRMKEQYGGQRGRCPHCSGAITVPAVASDDGMDLLPLDGNGSSPAPTPPAHAASLSHAPPAASRWENPPSLSAGAPSRGAPSLGGDSDLGLAPLEDPAAKPIAASAPAAPTTASVKPRYSDDADDELSLAPLEAATSTKVATHVVQTAQAMPAAETHATAETRAPVDKSTGSTDGMAAAAAPSDDAQRVACTKCGAKMRVPPSMAGRTIGCPKCKNKQRVPEDHAGATAEIVKPVASDTPPLDEMEGTGADLGEGLFGLLGEASAPAAVPAPAAQSVLTTPPKAAGGKGATKKKSQANTLLGMPPWVVYVGAAVFALVMASGVMLFFNGPSGASAVPPATASPGAKTPTGPTVTSPPTAPLPAPPAASPAAPAPMPSPAPGAEPVPAAAAPAK